MLVNIHCADYVQGHVESTLNILTHFVLKWKEILIFPTFFLQKENGEFKTFIQVMH